MKEEVDGFDVEAVNDSSQCILCRISWSRDSLFWDYLLFLIKLAEELGLLNFINLFLILGEISRLRCTAS